MSKPFVPNHTYLGRRIGLGKCIGWPFHDLDPRSWLWHWITKICFLHDEVRTTHPITTKRDRFMPIVMLITWLDFGEILLITFFFAIYFKKIRIFFQGQTLLAISQEWLVVWLIWNKKEMYQLNTGYTMWPSPLTSPKTLTLYFLRSNFEIAVPTS